MHQEVVIDDGPGAPEEPRVRPRPSNPPRSLPWHNDYLPPNRRGILLGEKLTSIRNVAIFALYVQFISTIAGFSLFIARRVYFL